MKEFLQEVLMHLRYGTWVPARLPVGQYAERSQWYVQRYWLVFPVEVDGPMTKREAEGVAAINNDSRGL